MQYLYYFANTSLVVRLLTYLSKRQTLRIESVTVIYMVDRWVVRLKLTAPLPSKQALDFESFLNENGYPYAAPASLGSTVGNTVPSPLTRALRSLDSGMSITAVMNKYHVVVVSHGPPQLADIESFRVTFVSGLGYCPPSLV